MRVLIVKLSSMGDVICGLPVAKTLKHNYPEGEVVWAVDKAFAPIVERCPYVDRIVVRPKDMGEMWRATKDLGDFEAVLDLQGLLKSGLMTAASKSKKKLGFHWQREGARLFSAPVKPDPTSLHVADQYLDVARALGAIELSDFHTLQPTETDFSEAKSILNEAGIDSEKPYFVMNAGAGWITKRWAPEGFALVSRELNSKSVQTVFIGAPADSAVFEEVKAQNPGEAKSIVGKTNLPQLMAVIAGSKGHLGGDTGSTHMTSALAKKAFGVYTLTKPERSCPYGQISRCQTLDAQTMADQIIKELE